jgi:hypothetical protein
MRLIVSDASHKNSPPLQNPVMTSFKAHATLPRRLPIRSRHSFSSPRLRMEYCRGLRNEVALHCILCHGDGLIVASSLFHESASSCLLAKAARNLVDRGAAIISKNLRYAHLLCSDPSDGQRRRHQGLTFHKSVAWRGL